MGYSSDSFALPQFIWSRARDERPFTIALACSGVAHVVATLAITTWFVLTPTPAPAPAGASEVLQATLQVAPAPELEAVVAPVTPDPLPDPSPEPIAAPSVITVPSPALAVLPRVPSPSPPPAPIYSTNPDGTVTIGMVKDPTRIASGYGATLAARYPAHVDREPRLRGAGLIAYPAAARAAHASARIAVFVDVDEGGKIVDAVLVPNHPWFGPAVTEALKNAQFSPAEVGLRTVPYWAIVEVTFAIASAPSGVSGNSAINKMSGNAAMIDTPVTPQSVEPALSAH